MKVIISRKGFDSASGGCASPIMPDGTMLSLPIPEGGEYKDRYEDLYYKGRSYKEICSDLLISNSKNGLGSSDKVGVLEGCHLDPDIRPDVRKKPNGNWKPAFGQVGARQVELQKAGVEKGDLFLFFGWFRGAGIKEDGKCFFNSKVASKSFWDYADIHAIYGYLQIGDIITDKDSIAEYYWHPHSGNGYEKNNTLYIPSNELMINSIKMNMPGYGIFGFNPKRVLTREGETRRSYWNKMECLMPDKLCVPTRENSSKDDDAIYYAGRWQELVFSETPELIKWVRSIITD